MGGICWVARALKASATKCGFEETICFHPGVSMTSVACRLLINSMAWDFSCSAECRSARMRVSLTFSTLRFLHSDSSHMTFNLSKAYLSAAANKSAAILSKCGAFPEKKNQQKLTTFLLKYRKSPGQEN